MNAGSTTFKSLKEIVMRSMGAWMLAAGIAVVLTGCNDQKKVTPVETAPIQTAAPAPYPGDAGTHRPEPLTAVTPSPAPEPVVDPAPAAAPVPEAAPVDTAPPVHKAAKHAGAAKHHEAAAVEQGPKESYPKKAKTAGGKTYTVKKGDTLQEISQKYYGTTKNWRRIYKANEKKIGTDPNKLVEGMKIHIP
jgi:nucleoid-associated protein YgaU